MKGVRSGDTYLEIDQVPGEWPYVNFQLEDNGSLTIEVNEVVSDPPVRITLAPERTYKAAKKIRKFFK